MRMAVMALVPVLLAGCSGGGAPDTGDSPAGEASAAVEAVPLTLPTDPASWRGTLPCADCSGIRTTLTLQVDGTYRRSDAYLGASASGDTLFTSAGRWFRDGTDPSILALVTESDGLHRFQALSGGALRALDREGEPIASDLPDRLQPVADAVHGGRFQARGGFSYFADAALFVTCEGGLQLPVAMEGGYLDLERAYGASGIPGPEPMHVRVTGALEERPAMDGGGTVTALVVDSHAAADGACPVLELPEALAGSWRMTHLDGAAVPSHLPAPNLTRDPAEAQLSGSAGCNRFTGRGPLRGSLLVPGPLAATRRFCEGVMELEGRVLEVLSAGGWLRLEGGTLVLRHGPDEVARFEPDTEEQP